jgi:hypothetical protein
MKTHLATTLAIAAAGLLIASFLLPESISAAVLALGVICLLLLVSSSEGLRRVMERRRRSFLAAGASLCIGAIVVAVWAFSASPGDQRIGVNLVVMLFVAGLAMIVATLRLPQDERDRAAVRTAMALPRLAFSPLAELRQDLGVLAQQPGDLARVVGPYFALYAVFPFLLLAAKDWEPADKGAALFVLLGIVALLLLLIALPVMAALQWARFVGSERTPSPLDLPWRAFFGLAWRLFLFGYVFRLTAQVGPWLKAHVAVAPWAIAATTSVAEGLVLVMLSPYALIVPALALGQRNVSAIGLAVAAQRDRRFYVGPLVILAPITLLNWVSGFYASKAAWALVASWTAWALVLFGTLVVAMTYLTRVYLRLAPQVRTIQ